MESRWGWGEEMLPGYEVVWLEVLESVAVVGGVSSMVLKEPVTDSGSHSHDHGDQDCDWGGGA
jgi:hypothetical protein